MDDAVVGVGLEVLCEVEGAEESRSKGSQVGEERRSSWEEAGESGFWRCSCSGCGFGCLTGGLVDRWSR